jgi:hypothetical protein
MTHLRRILCGVTVIPTVAAAQTPRQLAKPDAEFAEPFSQVASIRELRDGRVLVLDRRDRIVMLVDLKRGTSTKVGAEGTGPGEYVQPGRLFAMPADTTAIYDGPARRFVMFGADGKFAGAFRLDSATGSRGQRGGVPKGSDGKGRMFTEGSPYAVGMTGAADSAAIVRFDRGDARGDTLAYVALDREAVQVRSSASGGVSISNGLRAFASRDDWVALPDGGVAVIRVAEYHVDWYSPLGRRSAGPVVKVEPLPVTDADKEQAANDLLAAIRSSAPRNGNASSTTPKSAAGLPALPFPTIKPPFESGNVFARPNGEVWVLRSRKAKDPVAVYDVFTATGGMIGRVALPPRTRLVGFGQTTLYAVRVDDDDLQYLARWTLP